MEFLRDGKRCNMKFFDVSVRKPPASVTSMNDEGNAVVFGPQVSHITKVNRGQRIPTDRRRGVFVLLLLAQVCSGVLLF